MSMKKASEMFSEWVAHPLTCKEPTHGDWRRQVQALQAKIDELMLEHCPEEMTKEQLDEYDKHQVPVSSDTEAREWCNSFYEK